MGGEGDSYLVICWALLGLLVPFRGAWKREEGRYTSPGAAPLPRDQPCAQVNGGTRSEPQRPRFCRENPTPAAPPSPGSPSGSLPAPRSRLSPRQPPGPRREPAPQQPRHSPPSALPPSGLVASGSSSIIAASGCKAERGEGGRGGGAAEGCAARSTLHSRFSSHPAPSCAPCWP